MRYATHPKQSACPFTSFKVGVYIHFIQPALPDDILSRPLFSDPGLESFRGSPGQAGKAVIWPNRFFKSSGSALLAGSRTIPGTPPKTSQACVMTRSSQMVLRSFLVSVSDARAGPHPPSQLTTMWLANLGASLLVSMKSS